MAKFSVTFEIVTQESAAEGEADERGFIGEGLTLRDAVKAFNDTRTCHVGGVESIECSASSASAVRWVTITNSMEYLTGAQESRAIHFPEAVTSATRRRIARLLGAGV